MQRYQAAVREAIRTRGPLEAFRQLIAANDELIRGPKLDNGRAIVTARTAIYTELVRTWADAQQKLTGYRRPFAVVALGGTGRAEMTPFSDNDFAFLFEDALEDNPLLLELQRQVLHTDQFKKQYGFACLAIPLSLDDVPSLEGKQLNAFLDMRPVHDPQGLTERFRERIRATFDPFEHFLHVRGFWKDQWEKAAGESERLDRFDIKNDGLRIFLAGIWTLAGKHFVHSHEIYSALDDPRDLEAYEFLLRIRAFVHSRHASTARPSPGGNHPEDILGFDDFLSFGEMLEPSAGDRVRFEYANEVRARLLSARRRVARFAKGVIERELAQGRAVNPTSPIVYGLGGLRHAEAAKCHSPREKSRAALSLVLAAQRYGVPIDPTEMQSTFRNASDWLVRVPELSALFYEQRGSLAASFAFLSQLDGAEEKLFPGYAKFESSLDGRVMTERKSLRGVHDRSKLLALERFVEDGRARLAEVGSAAKLANQGLSVSVEAALLDADLLAAVKLALKTKRLPLTSEDLGVRCDESRPLHERLSSGLSDIPLPEYYEVYGAQCDFSRETVRVAEFLVAHRRAFKEWSERGLNDDRQVEEFAQLCQDEQWLRALFVFTCADRSEWEGEAIDPARWFNTRELYTKTRQRFHPPTDTKQTLLAAGYSPDQLEVLQDFGADFFGGVYRQYAPRFSGALTRFAEEPQFHAPKVSLLRDGASTIVGVAARDYRGLAATISGAIWNAQLDLRQAHLFSAMNHGLALDFFHLAPRDRPPSSDLPRVIEDAIARRLYISDADEAALPPVKGTVEIQEWRPRCYCLRFESPRNTNGVIYALTYKVFRYLRGNIYGLTAHAVRERGYLSIYHSLPPDISLDRARAIAAEHF